MIYIQIRWRRAGYMKARIPGGAISIASCWRPCQAPNMIPMNSVDRSTTKMALERSLDVLCGPAKETVLHYLSEKYGISMQIDDKSFLTIEEIKVALESMKGQAAMYILSQMQEELKKLEAS